MPRQERLSDVTVKMIVTRPISAVDATIYTSAKQEEVKLGRLIITQADRARSVR